MIKVIIGLEIHLELFTKRKAFSNANSSFNKEPNTNVSEIDMAYPGSMPLIEKEFIVQGLKACHVLNMNVSEQLSFDRKHYQYPDLPKGFQITQYFSPLGTKGKITLDSGKVVTITEIHLEEDTAKRTYLEKKVHLDYNRCGKPLLEIVTDPIFSSKEEVVEFLKWLRSEMMNSKISEGAMEKGSLRCDVNISLYDNKTKKRTNRVEVKNINSFRHIAEAIDFEINSQKDFLSKNKTYPQQTKKFVSETSSTEMMRVKDTVLDYRYMTEPNILPIKISKELLKEAKENLPIPVSSLKKMFVEDLNINREIFESILSNNFFLNIFNDVLNATGKNEKKKLKKISNWIVVNISDLIRNEDDLILDSSKVSLGLIRTYDSLEKGEIVSLSLNKIFIQILKGKDIKKILGSNKIQEKISEEEINQLVVDIVSKNEDFIKENIQERRERVEKMLMGQIMKETKGKANPQIVMQLLKLKLK